jgi:16S rRNA (cytidine1402-2'-O)-methyltransferase
MKMLEDILKTCLPNTKLCIAADITLASEFIKTKKIVTGKSPCRICKRPCIFGIYK